jgi:hypothetical protein
LRDSHIERNPNASRRICGDESLEVQVPPEDIHLHAEECREKDNPVHSHHQPRKRLCLAVIPEHIAVLAVLGRLLQAESQVLGGGDGDKAQYGFVELPN